MSLLVTCAVKIDISPLFRVSESRSVGDSFVDCRCDAVVLRFLVRFNSELLPVTSLGLILRPLTLCVTSSTEVESVAQR